MPNKDAHTIADLLSFLDQSPTAWHATQNCVSTLIKHDFIRLEEGDSWDILPGGRYFVTRNDSSICAFIAPKNKLEAVRVAAAHTDSPSFRLKPNNEFYKENMLMLGVEVYGAPMLNSWLNRDLGIAGRVIFKNHDGEIKEELVRLDTMPVVIPQLAIHLDRTVNENGIILNKQEHLAALASVGEKLNNQPTFIERLLADVLPLKQLISHELFLFPLESARLFGEKQHLIASYRIDNIASVHAALQGLLNAHKPSDSHLKMIAFWDNEEVGSHTAQGAGSPFLMHVIERIALSMDYCREDFFRILTRSLCASIDLSHATHPNYSDKHEPRHVVLMNKGIVIKANAQQRYATDARSSAVIIDLCHQHEIPFQHHVPRGDLSCGSTVGPVHATITGMPTVDIGCPQLSMHAAREIMGTADHLAMCRLITAFL